MSENGGNGGSLWGGGSPWGGGYQSLDRKIDAVERDFRAEIGAIRVEMREGNATILDRIDKSAAAAANTAAAIAASATAHGPKQTNPFQLVIGLGSTAIAIIGLLGSWFSYVSSNLTSSIAAVAAAANKDAAALSLALTQEQHDRIDDRRLVYTAIEKESAKAWSKDAQIESERRIDERNVMEQTYLHETIARLDKDHDNLANHMVPREEHDRERAEEKEAQARSERQLTESINHVVEHLNKSDERVDAKFSEQEKVLHAVGISDELKNLESHQRDIDEKFFRLLSSQVPGVAPKP